MKTAACLATGGGFFYACVRLRFARDGFHRILDVANLLLHFAFDLVCQALGLLFFAADDFASGFLDFTADFLQLPST